MPRKKSERDLPHTLGFPVPHPAQWTILNHPARFRVVACGRRFGKTELAKLEATLIAQDGGTVWWVSPTHKMALDVWGEVLLTLEPLASAINRTHRVISLPGGGELRVQSGHEPDRLRGVGLDFVVVDEAAFCPPEVWQVLRPALSDRGGRALFLSTPQGRNWFWHLYQRGQDPLQADWMSWQFPTAANPLIPAAEITLAQRDLPTRQFQEEYEAAFLADHGIVFRNIQACIMPDAPRFPPNEPTCMGIDWARVHDYSVLLVMGTRTHRVFAMDRFNQVNWRVQRERVLAMARRWQPAIILAEANSIGGPNIEA